MNYSINLMLAIVTLIVGPLSPCAAEESTTNVSSLVKILGEANVGDRKQQAIQKLGNFGPAAEEAVPSLIECLSDRSGDGVRFYAIMTLGKIGPAWGAIDGGVGGAMIAWLYNQLVSRTSSKAP